MPSANEVYKKVRELTEKGRDVKSCCRSVAEQLHLKEEDVIVAAVGMCEKWYKEMGYKGVRQKI